MPDNAHFTGVILRLNDDGSVPANNPFFALGPRLAAKSGRIFRRYSPTVIAMASAWHSIRSAASSGRPKMLTMHSAKLIALLPGMNGGWIQISGPLSRMAQFKQIETTQFSMALQQVRYPPTRLAYSPALAAARMVMLPGATYVDPDFSWKYEVGPSGHNIRSGDSARSGV